MRLTVAGLLSLIGVAAVTGAIAAGKLPQFWNLTSSTVAGLEISKAGANVFGANQTVNDPDGAVEHDERLKITDVEAGLYDVRLTLRWPHLLRTEYKNPGWQAVPHRRQEPR
jgi:hypothetical protein